MYRYALERSNVKYQILPNTKEVWARDYMPLHIGKGRYITFNFAPDYLDIGKKQICHKSKFSYTRP